jgi:hypothetical protein
VTTGESGQGDADSMTGSEPVPTESSVNSDSDASVSATGPDQNSGDDGSLGDGCGCKNGEFASLLWLGPCLFALRRRRARA